MAVLAVLAVAVVATTLLLRAREGIPAADEGYLRSGTLRTLAGEVPVRDFRSYEPGRYYWCALGLLILRRRGIAALRSSVHAFFAVGLGAGLLALRLAGVDWVGIVAAALVIAVWAHPAEKLFEPGVMMIVVLAGVHLVMAPGWVAAALLGFAAGGATFFGANLGLYAAAAGSLVTLLVALKSPSLGLGAGAGAFAGGCLAGLLPLLITFALCPGLMRRFLQRRVRAVLSRGTTNLPRPVPWPWRLPEAGERALSAAGNRCVGWLFVFLPALAAGTWLWAAAAPWHEDRARAALVVAAAVGGSMLHHPFSRADLPHLAPTVPVFALALSGVLGGALSALPVLLLIGPAFSTVVAMHPRWRRHEAPEAFVRHRVRGIRLWAGVDEVAHLEALRDLLWSLLKPDEPIVAAPTLPNLLPLLGRRSAVYDTFCPYPATEQEQETMLRSIEERNVRLVILHDLPLDHRDDLRFRHTHPRVQSEIEAAFERLAVPGLPPEYEVFWRETTVSGAGEASREGAGGQAHELARQFTA